MKNAKLTKTSLFAAIMTAIAGSLCCTVPLIFVTFGLGGAWLGSLSQLHVIHPYALVITPLFLGFAFWRLYINQKPCKSSDQICSIPKSMRIQRIIFWIVLIFAVLSLLFPYYGQWLL